MTIIFTCFAWWLVASQDVLQESIWVLTEIRQKILNEGKSAVGDDPYGVFKIIVPNCDNDCKEIWE